MMMPSKGTVIEVHPGRAIVMTDQCEFREIKIKGNIQPGEQIEFSTSDLIRQRQYPNKAMGLVASFLICCLVALASFQYIFAERAYAYIGFDLNPSLEIGLSKDFDVIHTSGFNDDGSKLAGSGKLLDNRLDESIKLILQTYAIKNYIAVSLYAPRVSDPRGLLEEINKIITTELAGKNSDIRLYYFVIDKQTREQAIKQNVSPIKYLLWEESRRRGVSLTLKEISLTDPRVINVADGIAENVSRHSTDSVNMPLHASDNSQQDAEHKQDAGVKKGQPAGSGIIPGVEKSSVSKGNENSKADPFKQPVEPTPVFGEQNGSAAETNQSNYIPMKPDDIMPPENPEVQHDQEKGSDNSGLIEELKGETGSNTDNRPANAGSSGGGGSRRK